MSTNIGNSTSDDYQHKPPMGSDAQLALVGQSDLVSSTLITMSLQARLKVSMSNGFDARLPG